MDLRNLPAWITNRVQTLGLLQGLRLRRGTTELPRGRYKAIRVLQKEIDNTAGLGHYSVLLIPDDRDAPTFLLHAVSITRDAAAEMLDNAGSLDFGANGKAGVAVLEQRDAEAPMGRGVNVVVDRSAGMFLSQRDLEMLMTSRAQDGSFRNVGNCMTFADMVFEDLADTDVTQLQDVSINDVIRDGARSPAVTKTSKLRRVVRPETVLVIGGTGVGKSTVSNMLFNQSSTRLRTPFATGESAASVTKDMSAIFSAQSNLLIVDTIGAGDLHKGNHAIVGQIRGVFRQGAVGLSAVVLVVNMSTGLSRGDRANLELLSEAFDTHLKTHGVIVATHYEHEAHETEVKLQEWLGKDEGARKIFGKFKTVIVTDNSGNPEDPDAAALASACLEGLNAHIASTRTLPRAFADTNGFQRFLQWLVSFFRTELPADLQQVERELAAQNGGPRACRSCKRVTGPPHALDTVCCSQWVCVECARGGNGLCPACGMPQ